MNLSISSTGKDLGFQPLHLRFMRRVNLFICGLVSGLIIASAAHATTFYDRHVFFDNSLPDRSYFLSEGMTVAPSKLELVDGKFPVDSNHFLSPPNSLRLKW